MKAKNRFTKVQANTKGKEWFIWFRFYHLGKWYLVKRKEGINRIKERKEKRKEIELLREAREQWLKEGWNPVIDPTYKLRKVRKRNEGLQIVQNEENFEAYVAGIKLVRLETKQKKPGTKSGTN